MSTSNRAPWFRLWALLVGAWFAMTSTHELGHLIGGWCGGGTLVSADLWPWHLPHSLFAPDPHPLLTLWGGPLLGVGIPVLTALVLRRPWVWFIAASCVLANGLYLATAWVAGDRYLDTPRLLEQGASPFTISLYCFATLGWGYWTLRKTLPQIDLPFVKFDSAASSGRAPRVAPHSESNDTFF
ncbi:MAG TPA: hypothetical protein DDY91_14030 [Planctomycetaceae bacterium]|nr:hypothetical protein [Planctomycetaceae bacterium]